MDLSELEAQDSSLAQLAKRETMQLWFRHTGSDDTESCLQYIHGIEVKISKEKLDAFQRAYDASELIRETKEAHWRLQQEKLELIKKMGLPVDSLNETNLLDHEANKLRPANGRRLTEEQISFIQGAGHSKTAELIVDEFSAKFGFKITERTVIKYRNKE